jgi:hypothetical protein
VVVVVVMVQAAAVPAAAVVVVAHVAAVAEFPIMSVICDDPVRDHVILVFKNPTTFNARCVVALCGNHCVMTEEYYP